MWLGFRCCACFLRDRKGRESPPVDRRTIRAFKAKVHVGAELWKTADHAIDVVGAELCRKTAAHAIDLQQETANDEPTAGHNVMHSLLAS